MNGKRTFATIVGMVLALQGTTARAAGFGINEHSAKAMGLAGAYTAIADTPAAMFFNPAGLATLRGLQFEAGLTFLTPGAQYSGPVPDLPGTSATVNAIRNYFFLPNIYASYRIHERVAVGLGFFVPYGLTMEWPTSYTIDGQQVSWWGRNIVERIALNTFYFTPQVAVNLHPRVQLGAGLYVVRGLVELRRGVTFNNSAADDINVDLAASAMGYSGTAGLLITVIPDLLKAGFCYRGGVHFDFKGNAAFTRADASSIPAGLRSQLTDGPAGTSLSLPHVFSFGLATFPVRTLSVSLNFDVITWSDYGQLAFNFGATSEAPNRPAQLNSVVPKNWSNTVAVRLGAEYRVIEALALRAGFIYDQSPAPRTTVGPDLPDADRYEFTLGAGYHWRDLRVDLAYQYLTSATFRSSDVSPLPGNYRADAHIVGLSLGYVLSKL